MPRLILILAVLLGLYLLSKHMRRLDPQQRKAFYFKLFWIGLVAAVTLLALTGRLHIIAAVVTALIPFARRLVPLLRYVPGLRRFVQRKLAGLARVETSLLLVTFNPETGRLDGTVKQGEFEGRALSSLNKDELARLYEYCCAEHPKSRALLAAYLDRAHRGQWREQAGAEGDEGGDRGQAAQSGDMSIDEAFSVLGLDSSASKDDVVQAHRKLMQKLHPDRGGSDYLAAKVNEARRLLLEHLH